MRVKEMKVMKIDGMDTLITISSNGEIKFWDCLYLVEHIDKVTENKQLGSEVWPIYTI